MTDIFEPYRLASQLDDHFKSTCHQYFGADDFTNIADTFRVIDKPSDRLKTLELYKSLPREEVIKRARKVSLLAQMLFRTKIEQRKNLPSNDLQSSSTPSKS